MRISDLLISNNYLSSINTAKIRMAQLQNQLATGNKVNRPSDSPSGTTKILQYLNGISQTDGYSGNIENSLSALNETSFSMESMQSEIVKILTNLTEIENVANNENLGSYADQIDLSLNAILNYANSKYDGKYLFGGTDFSSVPFGFSADGSVIEVKAGDVSGSQKVKLSPNITQKINITGTELFGTILSQRGTLDKNSAVGDAFTNSVSINDSTGNPYSFNATFTKTDDNTYALSYDVVDSGGNSIYGSPPAAKTISFDPDSGRILTMDGKTNYSFSIKDSGKKIDFNFDTSFLKESNSSSLTINANQQNDIFNTLIQIRDNLRLGIRPTEVQEQIVNDFNSRVLDKISNVGNVINQLNDANDLLSSQKIGFQELLSKEQSVDVAQSVMDLQNQDYLLQVAYKLASTTLPKSLLDYL